MAKYVLVEFDNDDEAEGFAAALEPLVQESPVVATGTDDRTVRVRGVFKKPTQFCECPPSDKSVRGKKWGWWVHKDCGRPKRGSWQHPRNLLDPIDMKPKERTLYIGVAEGGKPYARDTSPV